MIMLTEYQLELIHREVDGENSPEASAEVRELVATQPEALTLMTSLQSLDALIREVPTREPPPGSRQSIQKAMSLNPRASPKSGQGQGTQAITGWAAQQWNGISNFMESLMLTKKVLLGATTAVAAIAIIGYAVVGYPPSVFDAGTIGGVQKAERYKGKTAETVTLASPEIQALLQNDKILKLVRSDVFREVMRDDAMHELMSSEAYHDLMSNDAYRELLSSEAYRDLQSSEAYRDLQSNAAYRELQSSEAYRDLQSNQAYRDLQSNQAYRELQSNQAYRELFSTAAYRELLSNEAYHDLMSNDAYRELSRDLALSQAFLNEASYVRQ